MPRRKTPDPAVLSELEKLRARNAELEAAIGAPGIREIETRSQKAGTVTVACKIPMGLRLQLQEAMEVRIPTGRGSANDYVVDKQMVFRGKAYYVFGPSMPAMGGRPDGYILPQALEGGYAMTPGIPADFWEKWLEQNELAPYVENKMIFALDSASSRDKAREHGELTSGLEPMSREVDAQGRMKDRRIPKPMSGSVSRIAIDAERMESQERRPAPAE